MNEFLKELRKPKPSTDAEDWLVSKVCSNVPTAEVHISREFFLGEYSFSFLDYLGKHLYGTGAMDITGEYYEFISTEGGRGNIPYYKVWCFDRRKASKLKTYVATITARYFTAEKKKEEAIIQRTTSIDEEDGEKKTATDMIENPWFDLLIAKGNDLPCPLKYQKMLPKLNDALQKLPYNERRTVQLVIMDTVSTEEAFDELFDYMNAKKDRSEFTKLEKQRSINLLKSRALAHLRKYMSQ